MSLGNDPSRFGPPTGVEHLDGRLLYRCDCCRHRVAAADDSGTPWNCPRCGHTHRGIESYVDGLSRGGSV